MSEHDAFHQAWNRAERERDTPTPAPAEAAARCYDCCHEDCTGDSGERPHCGCPRQVAPVVEAALRKVMERNGLPERVVVDSNGAYWREYPDGEGLRYSMCPVSTDNDPIEPIAVYTFDRTAIPGPLALAVKYEVDEPDTAQRPGGE